MLMHSGQQADSPLTELQEAYIMGPLRLMEVNLPPESCKRNVAIRVHSALRQQDASREPALPPSAAGRLRPRSPAPSPRRRAAQWRPLLQHLLTVPPLAALCAHGG